jgi:hypothetical protein
LELISRPTSRFTSNENEVKCVLTDTRFPELAGIHSFDITADPINMEFTFRRAAEMSSLVWRSLLGDLMLCLETLNCICSGIIQV